VFKRIIIKLSGEALAGNNSDAKFDDEVIDRITAQIINCMRKGTQVALVVGGGNFWRGRDAKPGMDRVKADQIGMMATVMNALYLTEAFREKGVEAVIMTPVIIGVVTEQFSKKRALDYMRQNVVVIFAGGTGHPFFSTDTITAIRGAELETDAILFAKNVDGVYDSDPRDNSRARKLKQITYKDIIINGLKVIDLAACSISEEQGLLSVIFGLDEPEGIELAASGKDENIFKIGTKVTG
jgi:uridylate kinase